MNPLINLCHASIVPVCPMCGSHAMFDHWRSWHDRKDPTDFERDWQLVTCGNCGWYGVCPQGAPLNGCIAPDVDPKWLGAEMVAARWRHAQAAQTQQTERDVRLMALKDAEIEGLQQQVERLLKMRDELKAQLNAKRKRQAAAVR